MSVFHVHVILAYMEIEKFWDWSRRQIWPQMAVAHASFIRVLLWQVCMLGNSLIACANPDAVALKWLPRKGEGQGNFGESEGLEKGLIYIDDITQQYGRKSLGQKALKAAISLLGLLKLQDVFYLKLLDVRYSFIGYVNRQASHG